MITATLIHGQDNKFDILLRGLENRVHDMDDLKEYLQLDQFVNIRKPASVELAFSGMGYSIITVCTNKQTEITFEKDGH